MIAETCQWKPQQKRRLQEWTQLKLLVEFWEQLLKTKVKVLNIEDMLAESKASNKTSAKSAIFPTILGNLHWTSDSPWETMSLLHGQPQVKRPYKDAILPQKQISFILWIYPHVIAITGYLCLSEAAKLFKCISQVIILSWPRKASNKAAVLHIRHSWATKRKENNEYF